MQKQLNAEGLKIYDIPADGDCLFSAIAHQMKFREFGNYEQQELRDICVDHMSKNKDEYIWYLPEEGEKKWKGFFRIFWEVGPWEGFVRLHEDS